MRIPDVHPALFELSNGLTVIVAEQHSAPVASVQAWCQTGSIHEGEWLGAEEFVSFDSKAVSLLQAQGGRARLLS